MLQPLLFLDRSQKDLSKNIWVIALIVNRFRDKRKKRNETETILLELGRSLRSPFSRKRTRIIRCIECPSRQCKVKIKIALRRRSLTFVVHIRDVNKSNHYPKTPV